MRNYPTGFASVIFNFELIPMPKKPNITDGPALRAGGRSAPKAELRRRAERRLSDHPAKPAPHPTAADTQRLFHELEVHQIELELQNAELQKTRDDMEAALERYTDLFDFAPVGYFSIDAEGLILEVNLTGAALLGVERSRLIHLRLHRFVAPTSQPVFLAFLKKVFAEPKNQACEAQLLKEGGGDFWASFRASACEITSAASPEPARRSISQATSAVSLSPREITSAAGPVASAPPISRGKGTRKWCRVAFADITARKEAEEAHRRLEALANTNRGLNQEIARRQAVEEALQKSEQHQVELSQQARQLSHQILHAQEEERKRISRELHDEIAQTLVGINVHLAALTREGAGNPKGLRQKIARTQRLVEKMVDAVNQFARELRPTALDDLGLIPALQAFMKEFMKRTGVRARLTAFAAIEQLDIAKRTILYRVAHEALNNVARHARASRVEVNIEQLSDCICMKIKDDGRSFDVGRVLHAKGNGRLGLLGMRERLEMVGGKFLVESTLGQGTIVQAQVPVGRVRAGGDR